MLKLTALLVLSVPGIALAEDAKVKRVEPPVPAEIKATVEALKGKWTFDATITASGAKPQNLGLQFNCKPVSGGNAVACEATAKSAPWEASFLVGYDPFSKAVRFFQITNQYEVRDHLCKWKGSDLECAPQKGGTGVAGDEVSDEIKMHFEKDTCTFTSTTKGKAGTVVFEGKGKR